MAVKHIAFTVYPVKDMARARTFYERDLGLTLSQNYDGKWVEYHLENGAFAISTMIPIRPGAHIAFEVDDLDATMVDLKAKGVKVKAEVFHSPVCRMAVVVDPEGNALTLHQKKES